MTANELLQQPANQLPEIASRLAAGERDQLRRELEGIAAEAAFTAAYLDYLRDDQGHESALRSANRTRAKVRKALGYDVTPPYRF